MRYVEIKIEGWARDIPILKQLCPKLEDFAHKHGGNQLSSVTYLTLRNGGFRYVALAYDGSKLVGLSAKEERKFSVTVVHKRYRRQGIGRELMLLKKPIESWVDVHNLPMRLLCESLEMHQIPILGFNGLVMYQS